MHEGVEVVASERAGEAKEGSEGFAETKRSTNVFTAGENVQLRHVAAGSKEAEKTTEDEF